MVEFKPMTKDEFPAYWKYSVDSWKRDMERAGLIEKDISYEKAEEQVKKFLPNGIDTPGHRLMHIMKNEETIGSIWFEIRQRGAKEAYLWDIVIDENYRGKGYGRDTMARLEEFVKKEGAERISLNVFGSNAIARNLYIKMGYQDAAITMMKYL
ncbi:MAG: GNAT family N-acetyltransferase [Candidatus Thermoplasmatota archaeon]|nr:GNAT family N-acetyltransferase [Candidatus Thermoplasmatota archaeon]